MIRITVSKKHLHRPARKMRAILALIRNKPANQALSQLYFLNRGGADEIANLVKSGIAACVAKQANEDKLVISTALANQGPVMKRRWLRARGQATQIRKEMSHVIITISEQMDDKIKKDAKITKTATLTTLKKSSASNPEEK